MSDLRYDKGTKEWVDKFGNRWVPQAAFRGLWERGRLLKGQGQRPTVSEFLSVSKAYFQANPYGGSLHIVVEDDNLEDCHVNYCYYNALELGDGYGAALALLLLRMTRSQRGRVAKAWCR